MDEHATSHALSKTLFVIGVILFVVSIGATTVFYYDRNFDDQIARGVSIGSHDVSGLTYLEAFDTITRTTALIEERGVAFVARNKTAVITAQSSLQSSDSAPAFFAFDPVPSIERAYSIGRVGTLLERVMTRVRISQKGLVIPMNVEIDRMRINQELQNQLSEFFVGRIETIIKPVIKKTAFSLEIIQGVRGERLEYDTAIEEFLKKMEQLDQRRVSIPITIENPRISKEEAGAMRAEFASAIRRDAFSIVYLDKKPMKIPRSTYAQWLELKKNSDKNAKVFVALNAQKMKKSLSWIQEDIGINPENARFLIEKGKVKEFAPAKVGSAVDLDAMATLFEKMLFSNEESMNDDAVTLVTKNVEPEIKTEAVNTLGIKERIGVGGTNFSGSPRNRRHNIALGIANLNGILIKPDEEFSTLEYLGPVDGVHGFKEELVIKENKTTPEFGGGLCQVSTTLFRATMNAGLPVTARRNHSYRVRYYEPPVGKDATIYFPNPDFKFINDTGNYVLVVGRVEKDNAIFEFWGTKDGRTALETTPKVYGHIPPPPKKEIVTDELPPGEKKCTEKPHTGATADFTYTITYPSGEKKEQEFHSVYRPWQEVCMRGAEPGEELGERLVEKEE